jgi:hypothetical protein
MSSEERPARALPSPPLGSAGNSIRTPVGPAIGPSGPVSAPSSSPARAAGRPAPRPGGRTGPVYKGLPQPIRVLGWAGASVAAGAVLGATAPTALERLGAVAALRPGLLDWYTVRALGFLAYIVLAVSILYGLLLSTKILDAIAHRPVSFALHKDLSIVGLILGGIHGGLLIADQSYNFTPASILVPFESPYAPIAVGIGQLSFYSTAVVTASFYVRRHIGQSAWRLIHYATFLAFAEATYHGIASGTDTSADWAFWIYVVPLAAGMFLLAYRTTLSISNRLGRLPEIADSGLRPAVPGPLDRPGADS